MFPAVTLAGGALLPESLLFTPLMRWLIIALLGTSTRWTSLSRPCPDAHNRASMSSSPDASASLSVLISSSSAAAFWKASMIANARAFDDSSSDFVEGLGRYEAVVRAALQDGVSLRFEVCELVGRLSCQHTL
jgi:hypothetical protein